MTAGGSPPAVRTPAPDLSSGTTPAFGPASNEDLSLPLGLILVAAWVFSMQQARQTACGACSMGAHMGMAG